MLNINSIKSYTLCIYLSSIPLAHVRAFCSKEGYRLSPGSGLHNLWKYRECSEAAKSLINAGGQLKRFSTSTSAETNFLDKMADLLPEENEPTIFDKIISGEIPSKKVYEDDLVLAFHDISPQSPTHILLIPKERNGLSRLSRATEEHEKVLGHMLVKAAQIVKEHNFGDFRLVINNGPKAGQQVYHLHMHILAGRPLGWPPG